MKRFDKVRAYAAVLTMIAAGGMSGRAQTNHDNAKLQGTGTTIVQISPDGTKTRFAQLMPLICRVLTWRLQSSTGREWRPGEHSERRQH